MNQNRFRAESYKDFIELLDKTGANPATKELVMEEVKYYRGRIEYWIRIAEKAADQLKGFDRAPLWRKVLYSFTGNIEHLQVPLRVPFFIRDEGN